jgi:hypothetical protein
MEKLKKALGGDAAGWSMRYTVRGDGKTHDRYFMSPEGLEYRSLMQASGRTDGRRAPAHVVRPPSRSRSQHASATPETCLN